MTGRELIIYILRNGLEGEEIFKNGTFLGFLTEEEVAEKFDVGVATVKLWIELGALKGITIGELRLFPIDVEDPRSIRNII